MVLSLSFFPVVGGRQLQGLAAELGIDPGRHRGALRITVVVLVADLLVLLGYGLFVLVLRENQYAARTIQVEKGQQVISSGPYATVRHPMYVGFILWILGWAVYHGAVMSLAFGLMGIASILFWRRLEEGKLESAYGDAYRNYRLQTWF